MGGGWKYIRYRDRSSCIIGFTTRSREGGWKVNYWPEEEVKLSLSPFFFLSVSMKLWKK